MDNTTIDAVFEILEKEILNMHEPIVGRVARDHDPFRVLISTMLSLRTKDSTTDEAFNRLFCLAASPKELVEISETSIAQAIFPVGFYKTKAKNIQKTSRIIVENHGGSVPATMDELLQLPGVGRKTANLVLILGFDKMGICVDTHVHRITNRWGYLSTKTPDETEMKLRRILPERYWKRINDCLVPYGQNLCVPISPFCSRCRIFEYCKRVNVKKSR